MNFPLSTVVNVSVATPQAGVGRQNTSNVAIFTRENYQPSFGSDPFKIYAGGSAGVITDFGTDAVVSKMAVAIFSQSRNIRNGSNGGGYLVVIPFLDLNETLEAAIVRTQGLVQYFGVLAAEITVDAELQSAAAYIQGENLFGVFPGVLAADWVPTTGRLDKLRAAGYTQSRGVAYMGTGVELDGIVFSAAYMSRLMSVDFAGSKTAQTMNMKTLAGIIPDAGMTDTQRIACKTAGVDIYVSLGSSGIGGTSVSKVLIATTNGGKVDDVYASVAFGNDLQVAYFNTLAETQTKVPQTEDGMDVLKGALRAICGQYQANGYGAPGSWTSPDSFGDLADLKRNVSDVGFYIYTSPVALQDEASRIAGQATVAQIAFKEAGAVLSGNVLVNINP